MLGLPSNAERSDVAAKLLQVKAEDFSEEAMNKGLVVTACRTTKEW